ncbi:c-type cytochrome [Sphingosinicella terrae]|uniref:c-type cytochrome n=1 Tax=Sphingosinicella terrae TaxID=2172047 RepID=UPI0013B40038|nr:cytochrome c [Sphingosinicella terrae]
MLRLSVLALAAASFAVAGCDGRVAPAVAADAAAPTSFGSVVERGRYLAAIMDCGGCHNAGSFSPRPDAGYLQGAEVGHEVPGMGIFYPPNLTPHPEVGLGRWSVEQIAAAIRSGRRPDGRELAPAMPWRAYSALSDEDALALATYLKSLPPSSHRVAAPATPETAPRPYLTMRSPASAAGGR